MKRCLFPALAVSVCALTTTLSAAPTVAANGIKNSASYSYPGFPNGSIAQGSLFVVFGSALGSDPIQYGGSFPLPSNLAGTSVNVTVNGTTLPCPMIYTSSGQIAAILPSNTPVGTGTLVVSYNGTSNAAPIKVVTSSPGIFTVNQQGTGPGVIQDANGHQNALTEAFNPNQTVVVWGTGLGPINGSDAGTPPSGNLPGVTVTANVGGQNAVVQYSGRSSDAGVDQINITLPAGVTGCYVPVYLVAAPANGTAVTSNFVTVSIAAGGSTCSDPNYPNVTSSSGFRSGNVSLSQSSTTISMGGQSLTSNSDGGNGSFTAFDPTALATVGSFSFIDFSAGSCTVIQTNGSGSISSPGKSLDAGPVLNVNGPGGAKQMPKSNGSYSATFSTTTTIPGLPPGLPGLPGQTTPYLSPGTYTVDNGSGGTDVGPFKLNITVPPTFTWNEANTITSIDRSQPLPITWSGGDPNAQVVVTGTSFADPTGDAFIAFECIAKDSDLTLTVPSAILSLLPPSATQSTGSAGGLLSVGTNTMVNGSAPGLDSLTGVMTYTFPRVGITYK